MNRITYQVENWDSYYSDCQELWKEHYDEIAVDKERMEMAPDVSFYQVCEDAGMLSILTARQNGKMIGYFLFIVRPHPHYRNVLCAFEDAYFMSKSCRKGMAGVRLIAEAEKVAKARGAKKLCVFTKMFKDLGKIYERRGYKLTDHVYWRWL